MAAAAIAAVEGGRAVWVGELEEEVVRRMEVATVLDAMVARAEQEAILADFLFCSSGEGEGEVVVGDLLDLEW